MNKEVEKILIQARAKIIWGSPVIEIEEWLYSQGLSGSQVETVIKTCLQERNAEIRKLGLRDTIIGILTSIACIYSFISESTSPSRNGSGWSLIITLFGSSIWLLSRGISRLINGAKEKGSITEM